MAKTEITLVNPLDEGYAREGYIKVKDIRSVTVNAKIDTEAASLIITEELRKKLGLGIKEEKLTKLANGQGVKCHVTETVIIRWKNRHWSTVALVVPWANEVILGVQGDKIDHYVLDLLESVKGGIRS